MKHNALIYNYAQHYRLPIYKELAKSFPTHFYFGRDKNNIKGFDYEELEGVQQELRNVKFIGPVYWQCGVLRLARKQYENYILLGEYFCVSYWLLLILLKLRGKKVVMWTHGWYGDENSIKKFVKKLFFSFADAILLYGNYAKRLMIGEGFDERKLFVVYNSLDYSRQKELYFGQKLTNIYTSYFGNTYPNLLFVGRVQRSKKLHMILQSMETSKRDGKFYNLVIVGEGDDLENLKDLAKRKNLENNIWFYGACYDEILLSEIIFNANVCVSPGNVGLTAISSLTYGTPVITHNDFTKQGPEFEAIEEGRTGLFFAYDEVESLRNAIDRWFNLSMNREEVRKKCRHVVDSLYNPYYQMSVFKEVL